MSFHYIREPGDQGNILTGNTAARGIDLATLLDHTRPPLRAALELVAAIADVLTIAREDNMVHGDLKPVAVRIASNGDVAVEGFGEARRTTRAPEDTPRGQATDVYGLGIILYSLLSPDPLGRLPRSREPHDAAVLARIHRAPYGQLVNQPWLPDVQSFIATILAYDPAERPDALDIANVFSRVASLCVGDTLEAWAAHAIDETGYAPLEAGQFEDRLASARTVTGPLVLAEGTRVAPASKGHTATWSRERLVSRFGGEDLPPPRERTQPLKHPQAIQPQSLRAAPTLAGLQGDFERAQRTTERFAVPQPAPTMIPEMFDDAPEPQTRQLGPRAPAAPPPAAPPAAPPHYPVMDTMSEPPPPPPVPAVPPSKRADLPPTMAPPEPPPVPVQPRSPLPPTVAAPPPDMPPPPNVPPPMAEPPPMTSARTGEVISAATGHAPVEKKKGGALKYVAIGGGLLFVGCVGCSGITGLAYFMGWF